MKYYCLEKLLNLVGTVVGHMIKKISKINKKNISPDVSLGLEFSASKCVQIYKNMNCCSKVKKKTSLFLKEKKKGRPKTTKKNVLQRIINL